MPISTEKLYRTSKFCKYSKCFILALKLDYPIFTPLDTYHQIHKILDMILAPRGGAPCETAKFSGYQAPADRWFNIALSHTINAKIITPKFRILKKTEIDARETLFLEF